MKPLILFLITICTAFTVQAKNWTIIGKALENDTTKLEQNPANTNVFKYVGKITNGEFKLSDGTNVYIPVCGLNDPMGQAIDMEIQTNPNQTGFAVRYVNPNKIYVITFTNGVNPTLQVEFAVTYQNMYLIGGPVNTHNPNWILTDARQLDKDTANEFVFYYRGFLVYNSFGDEPGAIKFLTSNNSWAKAFHPAGSLNVSLSKASKMRLDGPDTKWVIPADGSGNGYYVIRLNTLDETIEVLQFTPSNIDYPNKVYITGSAMPCGWVNHTPEIMQPTNIFEGKYKWTGTVTPGQFKFLKSTGSWGSCYVSTTNDQPVEFDTEYSIVYEYEYYNNGGNDYKFVFNDTTTCTILVNLHTMKMVVKKGITNDIGLNKQPQSYKICGNNGVIKASTNDYLPKNISVYNFAGQKVYNNTFVLNTEFNIQKGFYIVIITDNKKQVCKKTKLVL